MLRVIFASIPARNGALAPGLIVCPFRRAGDFARDCERQRTWGVFGWHKSRYSQSDRHPTGRRSAPASRVSAGSVHTMPYIRPPNSGGCAAACGLLSARSERTCRSWRSTALTWEWWQGEPRPTALLQPVGKYLFWRLMQRPVVSSASPTRFPRNDLIQRSLHPRPAVFHGAR